MQLVHCQGDWTQRTITQRWRGRKKVRETLVTGLETPANQSCSTWEY